MRCSLKTLGVTHIFVQWEILCGAHYPLASPHKVNKPQGIVINSIKNCLAKFIVAVPRWHYEKIRLFGLYFQSYNDVIFL